MPVKRFTIFTVFLILSVGVFAQDPNLQLRPTDQKIELNLIELFPNPTTDFIIINFKDSRLSRAKIELRSMIGNKLQIEVEKIGPSRFRIPMKDFASGYYFIVVKDEFLRLNKAYKILKK